MRCASRLTNWVRRVTTMQGGQRCSSNLSSLSAEETGIGSYCEADLLTRLPQCESFFEKLHNSGAGSTVAAAQPAVENKSELRPARQAEDDRSVVCVCADCDLIASLPALHSARTRSSPDRD